MQGAGGECDNLSQDLGSIGFARTVPIVGREGEADKMSRDKEPHTDALAAAVTRCRADFMHGNWFVLVDGEGGRRRDASARAQHARSGRPGPRGRVGEGPRACLGGPAAPSPLTGGRHASTTVGASLRTSPAAPPRVLPAAIDGPSYEPASGGTLVMQFQPAHVFAPRQVCSDSSWVSMS